MMTRQMKSSGVEWIGDIPEKWCVCKTFRLLSMPITDGPHETPFFVDEGIPFISAEAISSGSGLINFSNKRGYISEDYYKECCKKYTPQVDDIYMIKSGATTGRVAYVSKDIDFKFTIWSPLAVFRANKQLSYPKYVYYFLLSDSYQKQIETKWSYGTQQNIGMRNIEKLFVCIPPLSEQKEIADYLDAKCAKIDAFITKQKTVIEKLKEYKQSVITEAVTKGLNPVVPMKISGVEWIGDIPEKWQILRLKNTVEHINEKTESIAQNYIGLENIESWTGHYINQSSGIPEGVSNIFRKNDILFSKLRPYLAKCLMADFSGICSSELLVLRNFKGYSRFLFHLLLSHGFINIVDSSTYGSKMPRANYSFIGNVEIPYPPLSEQKAIADYLDAKCAKIDDFIAKKQVVIEKLTEYKKSLIYECVTGKREIV